MLLTFMYLRYLEAAALHVVEQSCWTDAAALFCDSIKVSSGEDRESFYLSRSRPLDDVVPDYFFPFCCLLLTFIFIFRAHTEKKISEPP